MLKTTPGNLKFGNIEIAQSTIFYQRKFVFACVNLRPVVEGHVLLIPTRKEKKYKDLTETEAMELWISAKSISDNLKKFYNTDSVQIAIQDGDDAGQSIDHCHIHLIPVQKKYSFQQIDVEERQDRTTEDMEAEAEKYRESFKLN